GITLPPATAGRAEGTRGEDGPIAGNVAAGHGMPAAGAGIAGLGATRGRSDAGFRPPGPDPASGNPRGCRRRTGLRRRTQGDRLRAGARRRSQLRLLHVGVVGAFRRAQHGQRTGGAAAAPGLSADRPPGPVAARWTWWHAPPA